MSPLPGFRELLAARKIVDPEELTDTDGSHAQENIGVEADVPPDEVPLARRCLNAGIAAVRITLANDLRNIAREIRHF